MSLSRKTLLYSSIISVIIVSLIVGYFILMSPSLYVAYMQDGNYDSIVELQKGYMKVGSLFFGAVSFIILIFSIRKNQRVIK